MTVFMESCSWKPALFVFLLDLWCPVPHTNGMVVSRRVGVLPNLGCVESNAYTAECAHPCSLVVWCKQNPRGGFRMQDGGTRRPSGASPDGEQGAQKSRVDVCRAKERKEKGLCKYNGWEGLRHEGKPESRLAYEMPSLTCTPYTV